MRKNRWTVVLINFLKISPFQAKGQLRPNLVPICPKIIQPYVWDFFETFQQDETQQVDNSNIGQFPQNSCFSAIRQFEPNLGQSYATLYRKQLSHDMLSKIFKMLWYDGMQYLGQNNVSHFT